MRTILTTGLAAMVLAACQAQPSGDARDCAADRFAGLVGEPAVDLRQGGLPATARVIWPGNAVTQDFRADRLNVLVGQDGRVVQVACY
jgi:hypothetical protein